MKYLDTIKLTLLLAVLSSIVAGCVIEPVNFDNHKDEIKGAPDWVNRGSTYVNTPDGRMFYGVSSISLQGDMALQKSIAEDRARGEVVRVLSSYLEAVSEEYMGLGRTRENSGHDEMTVRQQEEAATKEIKEAISRKIDDAITRQFKETASRQFKEDVARQVKDASTREIREAIANQTEFSLQMEDIVMRQIKQVVARQLVSTNKKHISGAKIIGSWRDPRSNMIWSVAELDLKYVKTSMAGINELNNDLRKYFEQNTEMVFDRLIAERNNASASGWDIFAPRSR
jgi:hypothetical protein